LHFKCNVLCRYAEGAEDVTIKISDEGGGIRRSGLQRIWTYLYTTVGGGCAFATAVLHRCCM
jgi:hypothetical protein